MKDKTLKRLWMKEEGKLIKRKIFRFDPDPSDIIPYESGERGISDCGGCERWMQFADYAHAHGFTVQLVVNHFPFRDIQDIIIS
jgi:hypothetical protein